MTLITDPKMSPMMAQWHACKHQALHAILLFRLGDFYESFHEDALTLSKELDLTLTKRQEIPMAGIPFHASEGYIDKLVAKGYSVAIAEQMEDPQSVKGLVKREVVRVVTPGTVVSSTLLNDKSNTFLACIVQVGEIYGLSVLDLTTADFRAMECDTLKELADELCKLRPKELLVSEKWSKKQADFLGDLQTQLKHATNIREEGYFDHAHSCDVLLRHFRVLHLDGFGLKGMVAAINASGAILHYVNYELHLTIEHIQSLTTEHLNRYMLLDRSTQKNLELFESLHDAGKQHALLHVLDQTQTPMGGRLLRHWLTHPLVNPSQIHMRQDGIAALLANLASSDEIRLHLSAIKDLQRLMMRIQTGYATPHDLSTLRFSLEHIAPIAKLLQPMDATLLAQAKDNLLDVTEIVKKLQEALVDAPALRLSEGGVFQTGFNAQLDALTALQSDSHSWIARYQLQLKEETQIKTLKVGYTRAFGYYIEISRGQSEKIPPTFQRRQTLVNAERFITPELQAFEHQILHAEEKLSALQSSLFLTLRKEVAEYSDRVRTIAHAVSEIDCLLSLASVAKKFHYTRPLVDESDLFYVEQGRHPVVEASLGPQEYIPNDVFLDARDKRLYLITGPNMAGKSTFIRQVALLAIMAQMGSFIPAKAAHIGIIDKVFSRIGASDDMSRGQSTFMVEMLETANILHNATNRSLVILDEIGRGTSTYDGISIAWAVAEHLLTEPGKTPKTLFATHYWELTALEKEIKGAVNYNVAVHESESGIVFLRKIIQGGTDKSYGIHVAKLAGLPVAVLRRAEKRLQQLEKEAGKTHKKTGALTPQETQLSLFPTASQDPKWTAIETDLRQIDPNHLTPMQALQKILDWKKTV